jgi:hypothetical protein
MSLAERKSGFRVTYLILGVVDRRRYRLPSLLALDHCSAQEGHASALRCDQIVKGLRSYHHQVGRFPQSFVELEARVWRHTRTPNFGDDGCSLSMANYYYLYYAVDASACTLWAIPVNKRREEGSTFFLALSPEIARRWKGAPLALDEIEKLPALPNPAQLAPLGLTEQQKMRLQPSRTGLRQLSIRR